VSVERKLPASLNFSYRLPKKHFSLRVLDLNLLRWVMEFEVFLDLDAVSIWEISGSQIVQAPVYEFLTFEVYLRLLNWFMMV
jgi:hypothetical protein